MPGPSACDTIVTLTITQGDQPKENVQGLVCSGETFQYRGQQYAFGSHHLTYPGALCDTIYTIVVDTLPQPKTTETREVCTGKLTSYRGQQFSVGTYNFSFPGPVCDTLITLKVTNNPGQNINIEATICEGNYLISEMHFIPLALIPSFVRVCHVIQLSN
ncbi:MAG: hypothetical protein IPN87_18110 [Saprospiraceae bacterium]|nr:hypothetical protein [Candidatus Brachybacter algidus]